MNHFLIFLILAIMSSVSFAGSCPDGSDPIRSISADGSYYEFKCESTNNSNQSKNLTSTLSSISYDQANSAFESGDYDTAFKGFLSLAKSGDISSQEWTGYMYRLGYGINQNYTQAVKWFREAADQDSSYAQLQLGELYYEGQGVNRDYKQSLSWFHRSADQGNSDAQGWLGWQYSQGLGVKQDLSKALRWYQEAADQGSSYAQNALGMMYEKGDGVSQDYKKALNFFQKAADQGFADAQTNLGELYEKGNGVTQDYKKAFSLFQKAANQGDEHAETWLGYMYEFGNGVTQDYKEAHKWYLKSANQGYAYAQTNLAELYESGDGVTQDYQKAFVWFQKAANQGDELAEAWLGYMYEFGNGVTQDYKEAHKWYLKSANQGYAYAQNNLAELYESGDGVTQDYQKAFRWYLKSANQDYDWAQNSLGRLYENGNGVTQNNKLALSWYRKSAAQGLDEAKSNLKNLELKVGSLKSEEKIVIPPNAHASSSDSEGWVCNEGYERYSRYTGNYGCQLISERTDIAELEAKVIELQEKAKLAEQEALKEKAKKVFSEVQNQAENQSKPSETNIELEFWNSIKDSDDPEEYQIYLDEFPKGKFVKLAELRIKKLSLPSPSKPDINFGNYHALVIGNDKYRHLNPLANAINDASDVASLLRSKYNFKVNLLTNATRDEIVSALSELRKSISSSDNLLVYYAGHGYLDKALDEGFWLPIDAKSDNQVHWVANETVMRTVRAMEAKHVMVVADSCFSGSLTRDVYIKDNGPSYIQKISQKKARTVLTSGGLEPVSDVGGGNNSVFASSFLNALRDNDGVLDGNQLFSIIREEVIQNSDQTPEYGNIRKSGHDGGDFIFVSK